MKRVNTENSQEVMQYLSYSIDNEKLATGLVKGYFLNASTAHRVHTMTHPEAEDQAVEAIKGTSCTFNDALISTEDVYIDLLEQIWKSREFTFSFSQTSTELSEETRFFQWLLVTKTGDAFRLVGVVDGYFPCAKTAERWATEIPGSSGIFKEFYQKLIKIDDTGVPLSQAKRFAQVEGSRVGVLYNGHRFELMLN